MPWKIWLIIAINFIFSKDAEEEHVMHYKSNSEKFMIYDNANDIVDQFFKSLLPRYQNNLEISMREVILFLIQSNVCTENVTE